MNKQTGFTLLELLVTLSIVGILAGTAMPVYNTWQSRARGTEAALMIKQIMEGQILYFLENDKFFVSEDEEKTSIEIYHNTPPDHEYVEDLYDNIHVFVPTGHFLEYTLTADNETEGDESFELVITEANGRELFKGVSMVYCHINQAGEITTNII
jgi:prepilin-type N-terminal cleavage/methylation domain-containing protein